MVWLGIGTVVAILVAGWPRKKSKTWQAIAAEAQKRNPGMRR